MDEIRYTETGRRIRTYPSFISGPVDVILDFGRYTNYRIALQLIAIENGVPVEPQATATLNIPAVVFDEPNEVAIKNYSENTGMLTWLLEQGIVQPPHRFVQSGHAEIPICRLIVTANEEAPKQ